MPELLSLLLMFGSMIVLMAGFPVAFSLAGTALAVAVLGHFLDAFDLRLLGTLPLRIFGTMTNEVLVAIPLFLFMGVMLERSRIGEELLDTVGRAFGRLPGGLGYAVTLVGMLLAATTGIVGATVVMMGLISLPAMLRAGYDPKLASGVIAAAGTLGQIIPPSIVLVILGDVLQGAHQKAALAMGDFAPDTVSVVDLFAGAAIPGLLLVALYLAWQAFVAWRTPERCPPLADAARPPPSVVIRTLAAPVALVAAVLGSILLGFATATEAAGVGAAGALGLALLRGRLDLATLRDVAGRTAQMTAMIFVVIIGASTFSLVFIGLDGERIVRDVLDGLPGGPGAALFAVMLLVFLLGFPLDFIEICLIVVPVFGPVLFQMGVDPLWFGVLMGINLQTSFLTPPLGPTLFYLRAVAPDTVPSTAIYRGAAPFVVLQLVGLALVWAFPALATWLPRLLFG